MIGKTKDYYEKRINSLKKVIRVMGLIVALLAFILVLSLISISFRSNYPIEFVELNISKIYLGFDPRGLSIKNTFVICHKDGELKALDFVTYNRNIVNPTFDAWECYQIGIKEKKGID